MAAKRDVSKAIPAQSRLHSGVLRKDRTAAVRPPLAREERAREEPTREDSTREERSDQQARSEAPTIPPPTEPEVAPDPDHPGYTSGTFVIAREVMGADLRRDPRSEK